LGTYSVHEVIEISRNYFLDDLTIDICKPDTHVSSEHQKHGQNNNVSSLFTGITRNNDLEKMLNSSPEGCINVTTFLYFDVNMRSFR